MTARYDFEILPVCLGLHMAHTGSADPLPSEDKARHVAWLRQRLAEWQPSHAKWERFDEAVKALVMVTLDEVDPMPLDVLTPDEQDLVIASIPLQTGLTRDGERVIAPNLTRGDADPGDPWIDVVRERVHAPPASPTAPMLTSIYGALQQLAYGDRDVIDRDALIDFVDERIRRIAALPAGIATPPAEKTEPRRCVAVLATDAEDRVLLVLSAKPGRAWELPGGGVNRGESAVDAAYREVLEETGIAIVSIEARRSIPGTPKPGAQYASTIYVMTASGAGKPRHGSDAINAWWFYKCDVLNMHSKGLLSDLASREDLLSWANGTTLTPEEEREAYQFGRLTGIGFAAGKQAIEASKARREMPAAITSDEAEAQLRALGQSSDMPTAISRGGRQTR